MSQTLQQSLDDYRRQFKSDAVSADKSLLDDVRKGLADRLAGDVLDGETVHVAVDLSNYFGIDREGCVQTLFRYLSQSLATDEEVWARWRLVDTLALLQRYVETVDAHRQFLAWARRSLEPDRLLWVMYDSTQALCWVRVGRGVEWLQVFSSLIEDVSPTPENRRDRQIYLETASVVLNKLDRPEETLHVASRVKNLSEEDPSWDWALEAKLTSYKIAISAYNAMNEENALRETALKALALLDKQWQSLWMMARPQRQRLLVMYHDLGATLYLAGQHALAVPPLHRAVDLNSFVEHTYLWLAASLWATTKDRDEVLAVLQQGARLATGNRGSGSLGYDNWKILPEFQDVLNDPAFLYAVKT
jgi:tetratricopeptide (TPR) repeat protein